jgi:uncharacterized protein YigA (DUF484 family)
MNGSKVKQIVDEARCSDNPSLVSMVESMASRVWQLEWQLQQARSRNKELEQRIANIEAIG